MPGLVPFVPPPHYVYNEVNIVDTYPSTGVLPCTHMYSGDREVADGSLLGALKYVCPKDVCDATTVNHRRVQDINNKSGTAHTVKHITH